MSPDEKNIAPKVDPGKDKLTSIQRELMYQVQELNKDRIQRLAHKKRGAKFTGLFLAAFVASVYGYTIWAIKQERFLDDFLEPEKISEDDPAGA